MLNVLAQRRYRDRKRLERLKAQGKVGDGKATASSRVLEAESTLLESGDDIELASASVSVTSPANSHPSTEDGVALMDLDLSASMDWSTFNEQDLSSLLSRAPTLNPLQEFTSSQTGPLSNAFNFSSLSDPEPLSFASSSPSFSSSSSSTSISDPNFSFSDSYLLPVHELTILKGLMRICARLGCDTTTIWSMDCLSPFNLGLGTPSSSLPKNWQPTASQKTVPHHPTFDLLPWPSARDKILMLLALPDEARPPVARGPMCLVNFVYALEDGSEGVRIYGDDPCDAGSWEVGQVLFERWWFLFDGEIVENSNRWRELRGAPPLTPPQLKNA